jgi:hypothetical protein
MSYRIQSNRGLNLMSMPSTDNLAAEPTPSITFITCIETGVLEHEVVLMVASLRRFGGRFAQCPILALTPREVIVPLRPETRKALDELGVTLVQRNIGHRYRWWNFMNKPTALVMVRPLIKTKYVVWIDGDILVARPPEELDRHHDKDMLACVEDQGPVSTGPDSELDSFWERLSGLIGVPFDQLPWVTAPATGHKIRIYFNSGLYRYRVGTDFEDLNLKTCEALLDSRLVPKNDPSIFLYEQISLGLTVARMRMNFLELEPGYNFHTEPSYEKFCPISRYKDATLFHYHRGLRTDYRPKLIAQLRAVYPELADLVESHGPHRRPPKYRAFPLRVVFEFRKMREKRFVQSCARV